MLVSKVSEEKLTPMLGWRVLLGYRVRGQLPLEKSAHVVFRREDREIVMQRLTGFIKPAWHGFVEMGRDGLAGPGIDAVVAAMKWQQLVGLSW